MFVNFRALSRGLSWSPKPGDDRPRDAIVWVSLIFLLVFLITSIVAITFPVSATKISVGIINAVLSVVLLLLFFIDLISGHNRTYKRNLANTVLTVSFTIIVMTVLYMKIWYGNLNREGIELLSYPVASPRFPAIAVFQQNQHSRAVLQDSPLKCFLGKWIDHAPLCTGLTAEQVRASSSCDCSDRWPSLEMLERGDNKIEWLGQNMSYYELMPSESMISSDASKVLSAQIFFTYNTVESLGNSSVTRPPLTLIAVYDPAYKLSQMVSNGLLQAAEINANSHTVINIGLKYYEYLYRPPIYRYDLTIYTSPNLDLVCDVTKAEWYPCHLHLDVKIPIFLQSAVREVKVLSWSGVIAEAGAYFAFVQFLCWILSGQAWAP